MIDITNTFRGAADQKKNEEVRQALPTKSRGQLLVAANIWKSRLEDMADDNITRSHCWRMMTVCKIAVDGFTEDVLERLKGPVPPADKSEHSKRCAYLCNFLNVKNGKKLDTKQLRDHVQPWFCRDWRELAKIEVQTAYKSIIFQGYKGSSWSIGRRLETDELAKDDLKDLVQQLTLACYHDMDKFGLKWQQMVAVGADIWSQRTGITLDPIPPGWAVMTRAKELGWKNPSTSRLL